MELTVILAQKIAGLAIYIALGFLAVRLKVLTFQDSKALSTARRPSSRSPVCIVRSSWG